MILESTFLSFYKYDAVITCDLNVSLYNAIAGKYTLI